MNARAEALFAQRVRRIHVDADRMFRWIFLLQWMGASVFTLCLTPRTWEGRTATTHPHVWLAVLGGAVLNSLPWFLISWRPGRTLTRHAVAATQMLWSALLIDLSGGHIETHFHVFVSLAIVAFYRDARLLLTALTTVFLDHLCRGIFLPESIYGVRNPEWWRLWEHSAWAIFEVTVLYVGCRRELRELRHMSWTEAELANAKGRMEEQVRERTAELFESSERYRALVENTHAVPVEFDVKEQRIRYIAPQATQLFGCGPGELSSEKLLARLDPADRVRITSFLTSLDPLRPSTARTLDVKFHRPDRQVAYFSVIFSAREPGAPLRSLVVDTSAQRKLEIDLRAAQKLESVGRLASGIAHEINTPVQFVSDSVHFVRDAVKSYARIIDLLSLVRSAIPGEQRVNEAVHNAERAMEEENLQYLLTRVPAALDRALDGLERIASIVRSLKEFAHPDGNEMTTVDLNQAVESTVTIARNEYKYVADAELDLGEIPPVSCFAGEVNQVVLNLVVNAAHAIADRPGSATERGKITLRTRAEDDGVTLSVSDTGCGIPPEIRERVFDPFFTTKEVGRGTGQGLALARSVVDKHKGRLWFETEVGKGTTFFVHLPQPTAPAFAPAAEAV